MSKWADYNTQAKKLIDWRLVTTSILKLELVGEPLPNGWCKCHSVDGADSSPSAGFNLKNGYYRDFRDGEPACSAYDLMVQLGLAGNFMEAKKIVAKKFGIKYPALNHGDPEHGITWQPWSDSLAVTFCNAKPPITVAGLKLAGARMCMRHSIPCFALPVFGKSPEDTVGHMFLPRNGQPFQHEAAKGAKCICKIQEGEVAGFVAGPTVVDSLTGEMHKNVFWCEGAPDMLAGLSVYPTELFVTNPHGCAERATTVQKEIIIEGEHRLVIIADSDVPGVRGAVSKAQNLGFCGRNNALVMRPPYEIEEKHGKDYRDYLIEVGPQSHPDDGLVEVSTVEAAEPDQEDPGESDAKKTKEWTDSIRQAERVLGSIGLRVTAVAPSGAMTLYCAETNRVIEVADLAKIKYLNWIPMLGASFSGTVCETQKDWELRMSNGDKGVITYRDFCKYVGLAAARSELVEYQSIGAGIWPAVDKEGDPTGEVLLIKMGGAFKYDNNGNLTRLQPPIYGRNVCDIGSRIDWFKVDVLSGYIQQAKSPQWRRDVYNELFGLVDQWRWQNDSMSQLAIGLIMSTAIQSMHEWRPIVALTGESNSGKTIFMDGISKLFGGLAQFSARSTAAGVFQHMLNNSMPLLLDEFDSGTEQQKLMKIFRGSSRGQDTLMGTAGHQGKKYSSRHLPWISGIHASSSDQADLNRMIPLVLLTAKNNVRTITVPDTRTLKDLGLKMVAGVIVTSQAALDMTKQLNVAEGDGIIQSRYRESYSVPYGSLGAFLGLDTPGTKEVMDDYLASYVIPEVLDSDVVTDQESLLLDILQSGVRLGNDAPEETASIAEILFDSRFEMHRDSARTMGVGFIVSRKSPRCKVALVGQRLIHRQGLLSGTRWANIIGILQILKRLPEELMPTKEKQMVAGAVVTCISVDYDALKKWVVSKGIGRRDAAVVKCDAQEGT